MNNTRPAVGEIAKWIALLNELCAEAGAEEVRLGFRFTDGSTFVYTTDQSLGDENELDYMGMEHPQ